MSALARGRRHDADRRGSADRLDRPVCRCDDLVPGRGVCALVDGTAVAVFRCTLRRPGSTPSTTIDPFTRRVGALPGPRRDRPVDGAMPFVASPLRKQRFDLRTGARLDDPGDRRCGVVAGAGSADGRGPIVGRRARRPRTASSRGNDRETARRNAPPATPGVGAPRRARRATPSAVTADRRREEQAELIERRGGRVLHGPVIRTLPLTDEDGLRERHRGADRPTRPTSSCCAPRSGCAAGSRPPRAWASTTTCSTPSTRAEVLARGPKAAGAALTAGLDVDLADPGRDLRRGRRAPRRHAPADAARRHAAAGRRAARRRRERRLLADLLAALGYEVVAGARSTEWLLPDDRAPAAAAGRRGRRRDRRRRHVHLGPRGDQLRRRSPTASGCCDEVLRGRPHRTASSWSASGRSPRPGPDRVGLGRTRRAPQRPARCHGAGPASPPSPSGPSTLDLDGTPAAASRAGWWSSATREPVTPHRPGAGRARGARPAPGRGGVEADPPAARCGTGESDEHVVEVTVGRLRRRLGPAGDSHRDRGAPRLPPERDLMTAVDDPPVQPRTAGATPHRRAPAHSAVGRRARHVPRRNARHTPRENLIVDECSHDHHTGSRSPPPRHPRAAASPAPARLVRRRCSAAGPAQRVLHLTWFAFFLTFVVWFNFAPFATTIGDAVRASARAQLVTLGLCNLALTVPARHRHRQAARPLRAPAHLLGDPRLRRRPLHRCSPPPRPSGCWS